MVVRTILKILGQGPTWVGPVPYVCLGGKIWGGWNSPSSKVTWPELQCISIRRTRIVDLELVNIRACYILVSALNFTKFSLFNPVQIVLDQLCFHVLISRSVLKIFAVKVESCPKSSRIFDFWPSQISGVRDPKKFVHKWLCPPYVPLCGKVS